MENVKTDNSIYLTQYARHDPAHCLCPGLFRTKNTVDIKTHAHIIKKADGPWEIHYNYGDEKLEFICPYILRTLDLRILQGLVALSGLLEISCVIKKEDKDGLLESFEFENSKKDDCIMVETSYYNIAREIGLNEQAGKVYKQIKQSIKKLFAVSVFYKKGKEETGHRLLSSYKSEGENTLRVALNPRITKAILGGCRTAFINMQEVRQIKGENTRILHNFLSGQVGPGDSALFTLKALIPHLWTDFGAYSKGTQRVYKTYLRHALAEINGLEEWEIEEYVKGKYNIKRGVRILPKRPKKQG